MKRRPITAANGGKPPRLSSNVDRQKMKTTFSTILLLPVILLICGCTKSSDRSQQELAFDFVRESKAVPLSRAGFAKTGPSAGEFRERFDALTDRDLEQLFVAHYVHEWDKDTLEDILGFLRSDAGKAYLDSALAQAASEQKAISPSAQRAFGAFAATDSGRRWLEGYKSIQPKIMADLLERIGANQPPQTTPVSAPR